MSETADEAAARIMDKYAVAMKWGDRRDDMAWTALMRADIADAIRAAVAPFDGDHDGRVGGSRRKVRA